jgi:putative transposase
MLIGFHKMKEPESVVSASRFHVQTWFRGLTVSTQHIIHTLEFKLYLNQEQEATLSRWMGQCCWVFNQALEQRIKVYKRRKESTSFYSQCAWLTRLRERIPKINVVPVVFSLDAIRRVQRGFDGFFRRCKKGKEKLGFPRFKSRNGYKSMECLQLRNYIHNSAIWIPKLGKVSARGQFGEPGKQKLLRVIRRASGWYAQVVVDQGPVPEPIEPKTAIGIDVGLTVFATLSNGEKVENPRILRQSEKYIKHLSRKVSRCKKRSRNRRKAVKRLARQHERVAARRKDFCHQQARKIVNRFDLIVFEDLNLKGMAGSFLAKSVRDAAWGLFFFCLIFKAANAGKSTRKVDARGTSQECPECGAIAKKSLSERIHRCPCGASLCRDEAAAKVILARGRWSSSPVIPVEEFGLYLPLWGWQAEPVKQEVQKKMNTTPKFSAVDSFFGNDGEARKLLTTAVQVIQDAHADEKTLPRKNTESHGKLN